jgi:hypothetical protein
MINFKKKCWSELYKSCNIHHFSKVVQRSQKIAQSARDHAS